MANITVEQANSPYNRFIHHNFITMEEVSMDKAVGRLDIHPESLNPNDMVHGGAIYALADNVCGLVVHADGRRHVTQNGNLHFISNQNQGVLRATATVRHRGKTTSVVSLEVVGQSKRLVATGEFSFYCIGEKLPDL